MKTYSKTVILVGPTCSGKTTLAKALEKKGYERIVAYTTRPKRQNEIDGEDYHFISEEEFKRLMNEGFFEETTSYNAKFGKCFYGTAKKDYSDWSKKKVVVLNKQGVMDITVPCTVYYLYTPIKVIKERAMLRGDSVEEIERRIPVDISDHAFLKRNHIHTNHWPIMYGIKGTASTDDQVNLIEDHMEYDFN